MNNMLSAKITVIGAGAVGLSTAYCIQKSIHNADVTVIADKYEDETLSFGAGGMFRPDANIGPTPEITKQWYLQSHKHYTSLLNGPEAGEAGIQRLSGYCFSSVDPSLLTNSLMEELFPDLRTLTKKELQYFPSKYRYGMFYTAFIVDPQRYLQWLRKNIEALGGRFERRTIKNLSELAGTCDVIVNCTGLRAKELTGDHFLTPVRGQAIKVKAPWIKHFYYFDGCYILPGINFVTLGGIKQFGDWNPNVSLHDKDYIWKNCTAAVPSLKTAEVAYDWVGLRPFRQPIRIEKEVIDFSGIPCKVVHNYGHGAQGINTSWGTAVHATDLVKEALCENSGHIPSKL